MFSHLPVVGVSGAAPFTIDQSCMYDATSSTRNRRNAIGAGSTQGVLSVWLKRTTIDAVAQTIYSSEGGTPASNNFYLRFTTADAIAWTQDQGAALNGQWSTDATFRDCSSWYHIFLWIDTNEVGGNDDRLKFYVNGVLQSLTWTDDLSFEQLLNFCRTNSAFGYRIENDLKYFNGLMSQAFYLHDGVLDISNFGEFQNGMWVPKDLTALAAAFDDADSASFFLDFADSAVLGKDVGAHGNNFTQTNMAADHQVSDSPTNNYCTWDQNAIQKSDFCREGGLRVYDAYADWNTHAATFLMKTGKWYYELALGSSGWINHYLGIVKAGEEIGDTINVAYYLGQNANGWAIVNDVAQWNVRNNGLTALTPNTKAANDVVAVAFDADANKMWFRINGTWINKNSEGTGDPAAGTNPSFDSDDGLNAQRDDLVPAMATYQTVNHIANFGQLPWDTAPPTGFKALCAANLPEPTIIEPTITVVNTVIYTGDGSADQDITGLGFQPDFVWIKNRDQADAHMLFDSDRGATYRMSIDGNGASTVDADTLLSFDADGFSVGADVKVNTNLENYVALCIKQQADFFKITTYTGDGTLNRDITHGLGVIPELVFEKSASNGSRPWHIYHAGINKTDPGDYYGVPSTDAAFVDSTSMWQDTDPTATLFHVSDGGSDGWSNATGESYILYLFASLAGVSKVFTYEGNGNAAGPYIYCGFRPRWVMIKNADAVNQWMIVDTARTIDNPVGKTLYADLPNAEGDVDWMDINSNGIKIRTANGAFNTSNVTYIGMAFAEQPFKYANAR